MVIVQKFPTNPKLRKKMAQFSNPETFYNILLEYSFCYNTHLGFFCSFYMVFLSSLSQHYSQLLLFSVRVSHKIMVH
jgi:hypothetical protein